jgi:hypothetical protein
MLEINNTFDTIRNTTAEVTGSKVRKWTDISLVFMVLLFSETARGFVMPTLAPYVTSVCASLLFFFSPVFLVKCFLQ